MRRLPAALAAILGIGLGFTVRADDAWIIGGLDRDNGRGRIPPVPEARKTHWTPSGRDPIVYVHTPKPLSKRARRRARGKAKG